MADRGKGNGSCTVGIDLGGTKILAAVLDREFKVLARAKMPTIPEEGPEAVVDRITGCVKRAAEQAETPMDAISGIGIGAPGPLDPETGVVAFAPNLGWHDVPLKEMLESRLSIPTVVENDVNAGTLGEHRRGAGQGVQDMIGVFVGTGIGGGVIANGKLHRGFNQSAGEVGHMVVEKDGPRCGCGTAGCWEAVASRQAIARRIGKTFKRKRSKKSPIYRLTGGDPSKIKSGTLKRALLKGDESVKEEVRREAEYLGLGVANLVNLLSPQMVVMGGGVVEALGEHLLKRTRKVAGRYALEHSMRDVQVVQAKLGDDAVFVGCAALVQERLAEKT